MPDPARARQNYEALKAALDTALQAYEEQPEQIAELLAFKSKFHTYSINNSVLIQRANPGATYVASFDRWKELGYSVKRGQRGIKILVPRTSTLFRTVDETGRPITKRLRDATPEEKERIRSGEIKTYQRTHFSTGSVFDISQTTCPPEDYPKFYHMGYPSEQHAALTDAMTAYAAAKGIKVLIQDVTSISLRGFFSPADNTITLSDKLNDTERLSTLSHELGHAMAFAADAQKEEALPSEVRELEADGVSIMLQTACGFPLTQSRITHFANAYRACMQREDFSFEAFLKSVDQIYNQTYQELQPYIENALQTFEQKTKDFQEDEVVVTEDKEDEKVENPVPAQTIAASTGAAAVLASEPVQETVAEVLGKDSRNTPPSFAQQVDEALQNTMQRYSTLYVSDTPKVLTDLGLRQLPMLITQRHLKNIVHPKDPANTRYHGLPIEQVKQLPQMLESPAMVARSLTHDDDLVVITAQTDPDNLPIMVAVHPNGQGIYEVSQIDSNFITSVYGRTNFLSVDETGDLSQGCFLGRVMQAGGLLYQDKEKSRQLARCAGLQLPRALTSAGSSSHEEKTPDGSIAKNSITQNSESVKPTDRKEEEPAPAVRSMEARTERTRRRDEQYREEMDAVKNRINILDLAQDLGYHVVRDGTHHSLEEHDSVVFYESTNTFCRFSTAQNTSDGRPIGGSVIDFVLHFNEADGLGLPVHTAADAIRYLKDTYRLGTEAARQHTHTPPPKEKEAEKPPFRLPDVFQSGESAEKSHLYAYLCKTRAIDHEVVHTCQQRGLLYEDTAHNVVFVGRSQDGKEIFGTRRSTWSHSHWRRDVAGSDQSSGWYVDNKSDTLYVTEAPIDALSIMTLRKDAGKDPMDVSYLATTGTGKLNVLTRRLQENPNIQHLVLAFDNDDAGNLAAKRAARILQEQFPSVELRRYVVKEGKDVNEYLQSVQERKKAKSPSQGPEKGPKRKRTITPDLEPA